MRTLVLAIVGVIAGGAVVSLHAEARATKPDEMKAAAEVSSEAEKWAASQAAPAKPAEAVPAPDAVNPAAVPQAPAPAPAVPAAPATEPAALPGMQELVEAPEPPALEPGAHLKPAPVARSLPSGIRYNEMKGTIMSVDTDQRFVRLAVEGGYNIQFSYDPGTILLNGGNPIPDTELYFGDKVQIRYAGKELKALEIERYEKAPRTIAP